MKCPTTLKFRVRDKAALDHLFEAQKHLNQAGVGFDTGFEVGDHPGESRDWELDWELDWSLKGAELRQVAEQEGLPPPFGWAGGKTRMVKHLLSLVPPHKTYVEPFAGAAALFWAKAPSPVEVLNDLDPDLMRFYQHIGDIDHCPVHKLANPQALAQKSGSQTPCEFLSDVMCSYGNHRFLRDKTRVGLATSRCAHDAPMFHQRLPEYQRRLHGAVLHNEDWLVTVRQYDAPDTFFYLDPPYHGTSRGYNEKEDQLSRLAQVLPTLAGKWLLTYDNHPAVRGAFKEFYIRPVITRYTMSVDSNTTRGHQLLIANYPLKPVTAQQSKKPVCTPAQAARLERCIKEVKARGGKVNPWAVCTASIGCRRGTRMGSSLLEYLLHSAAGAGAATAAATLVSRAMGGGSLAVTSPEAVIRVIDDRKPEEKKAKTAGVYSPSTVDGDQAEVQLGTLLAEIDEILRSPNRLGEVDPANLKILREGS